jgi:hypothetical protein
MALANCGEILADAGFDTILCDWDLEAPGLERYIVGNRQELQRYIEAPGVMDLLIEYLHTASTSAEDSTGAEHEDKTMFKQFGKMRLRLPSSFALEAPKRTERRGRLRLINAGRRDDDFYQKYTKAVQEFDWSEFYAQWAGGSYMEFFRKDLEQACDIVLIDSRTGVTEHGGVCTHHLADLVVVLTASNDLNLAGARWMARSLSNPELAELRGGRPLHILPVAARVEQTAEKEELVSFRRRLTKEFGGFVPQCLGDSKELLYETEIPYIPYYSFTERVVAREPEDQRETRFYEAYQRLTEAIAHWGEKAGMLEAGRFVGKGFDRIPTEATGYAPMTQIFVSHHMKDSKAVRQICSNLEYYSGGKVEFFLAEQIPGGENWRTWIYDRIAEADAFFLFLSGVSSDWDWCLYETGLFAGRMKEKAPLIVFTAADIDPPTPLEHYQTVQMTPNHMMRFLKMFFGRIEWANRSKPINSAILKEDSTLEKLAYELTSFFPHQYPVHQSYLLKMAISIKDGQDLKKAIPNNAEVKFESSQTAMIFGFRGDMKADDLTWEHFTKELSGAGMKGTWLRELEAAVDCARNRKALEPIASSFFSKSTGKFYRIILSGIDVAANELSTIYLLFVEEHKLDPLESLPIPLRILAESLNLGLRFKYEVLDPCLDWLEETMVGGGEDLLERIRWTFEKVAEVQRLEMQRIGLVNLETILKLFEDPAKRSQLRKRTLSWEQEVKSLFEALQSKDLSLTTQKLKALDAMSTEILRLISHRYHELIEQVSTVSETKT